MKDFSFDIETAAASNASDWFNKVKIKAPSNYKDEEKINNYIENERRKLIGKAALKWVTGRVLSYAMVDIDDMSYVRYCFDVDEEVVLRRLAADLVAVNELWGMNSENFDTPFVIGRMMKHKIAIPSALKNNSKDINKFFGWSSQSGQRGSLDSYLFGIGEKPKLMKGSEVPDRYNDYILNKIKGNDDECLQFEKDLEAYNIDDAKAVAEIVNRYRGSYEQA